MPAFSRLAQSTPFYYGWVVAGVVALTMMLSGAVAAPMFSVLIPAWEEEFGWSRTAISGAFSFGTIIAALTGPFAGRSLDKYSGRLVMGGGSVLIAASLIGLGFATSLVALYVIFSVGRTALMGIQNLGGHTVIANWFVRRRTFATAVAVNGSRVGLGIWPLLAAVIITTFGWREALWTLGAIVGLLSLVPLVLIVSRQPEDVGLHPDGRPLSALQPGQEAIMGELEPRWRAREAVRTSAFWFLLAAHMGAMVVGGGFGVHRISLFLDRGLSSGWVGPVLLLHALGMTLGGFLAAWAMYRLSYRLVISAMMAMASVAILGALVVPPDLPIAIYTFLESMVFGGIFAMLPVVYADYFGRHSIGTIRGITHPLIVVANGAGPIFTGFISDSYGSYTWAFVTFSAILGVGALCALLARQPVARKLPPEHLPEAAHPQ